MLILVRHGETAANAAGELQGQRDLDLTDVGRAQVGLIAPALPSPVDLVVSSPLRRARETAAALGRPVEVDDRWQEMNYGEWEGRGVDTIREEIWSRRLRDAAWSPPGGESLLEVGARVRAACEDLAERARTANVVVVSHVSPIKAAVAWVLGVDDLVAWRLFVGLASVTTVAVSDHGPVLVSFNQTAHLGGEGGV